MSAGPTNPISAKYEYISNKYTSTVFSQNWHLFAPDPVNNNVHIYIQLTNDISDKESNQWIDITKSIKKNNNTKLITPYNRTIRLVDGIFGEVEGTSGMGDLMVKYINNFEQEEKKENDDPIVEELEKQIEEFQKIGENNLYRFASSYVKSFMKDDNNKYIKIRLTAYETIPFSERNNQNYKREIVYNKTFDWKEIEDVSQMY